MFQRYTSTLIDKLKIAIVEEPENDLTFKRVTSKVTLISWQHY